MNPNDLKQRTKQFALRVIHLVDTLPPTQAGRVIGNQLLRSGTSVGANYRSACRGRSKADFIAKVGIAIEEADETQYWLEILKEAGLIAEPRLAGLMQESGELVAILTATVKTARKSTPKE